MHSVQNLFSGISPLRQAPPIHRGMLQSYLRCLLIHKANIHRLYFAFLTTVDRIPPFGAGKSLYHQHKSFRTRVDNNFILEMCLQEIFSINDKLLGRKFEFSSALRCQASIKLSRLSLSLIHFVPHAVASHRYNGALL